jgi:hypothetical protein
MKKLFVSCPMAGREDEDIKNSINKMHQIAEIMLGEKLELINTYINEVAPADINNHGLWFLGRSLEMMAEADCFIGFDWNCRILDKHKGCELETDAAVAYDIPTYLIKDNYMAATILPDREQEEEE